MPRRIETAYRAAIRDQILVAGAGLLLGLLLFVWPELARIPW
jgi:hypothetical protein